MKEFIAYEGEALTVEWFFDKKGKSEALDFFETLSNAQKRKTLMLSKELAISVKYQILQSSEMKARKYLFLSLSQTGFYHSSL